MDQRRKGILLIIGAALLWSTGGIGIKAVADSALKVTFYRSLFAAIALMLFLGRGVWGRRQWKSTAAFAIAIVSYGACLTAFVVATKWTTAANAIFLQYAGVVWVLLLSPIVLREPMRTRDVIAIVVAMSGMALFFVGRFDAHGMAGNAMALVSSVFFASLILVLRREQRAAQAAVTWGNVVCALAVLPFVSHDLTLTPRSFAVLAFLGVFQIGIAYVLFVRGLRDGDAGLAHRDAGAGIESDLGLSFPRREAVRIRDRRRPGRVGGHRLAHHVRRAGTGHAGSRLRCSGLVD
jgi:drug/metabolite transporter (DMT)-like permease